MSVRFSSSSVAWLVGLVLLLGFGAWWSVKNVLHHSMTCLPVAITKADGGIIPFARNDSLNPKIERVSVDGRRVQVVGMSNDVGWEQDGERVGNGGVHWDARAHIPMIAMSIDGGLLAATYEARERLAGRGIGFAGRNWSERGPLTVKFICR